MLTNTYSRPIPAPITDLRPAQETCQNCHWPAMDDRAFGYPGIEPRWTRSAKEAVGAGLRLRRPTGSAMPLIWAHAEYIRLLRFTADGLVFNRIPAVADRYLVKGKCRPLEGKVFEVTNEEKING